MKNLVSGLIASMALCFANPLDSHSQYYKENSRVVDVLLAGNSSNRNTLEENINFVEGYMSKSKRDSIGTDGFSLVRNKNSYEFHYELPIDSVIVKFNVKDCGSGPGRGGLGSSTLSKKDTIFYGSKNEFFVLDGFLPKEYGNLYDLIWNDAADLVFKEKVKEFNPNLYSQ